MNKALRAFIAVCAATLAGGVVAATFTVTKTADTNDGTCDADCSLREAIVAANAAPGADTVVLPAGTYLITIPNTNEDLSANGDLDITSELTISGAGSATTIIDGNSISRVFHIEGGSPVSITGVTIRGGLAGAGASFGGGINHNGSGTLTLTGVVVTGNTATGFGGGINNNLGGTVNLSGSTVSGNTASGFGGGINNNSNGSFTVTQSVITGNTGSNGGGINNNNVGPLTVTGSTIAQNTANGSIGGGGILNNHNGTATIVGSTISGNTTAGFGGGGVDNNFGGTVNMSNSTVSGNTATGTNGGGGIYNNNSSGSINLLHVTVAGNQSTNGGRNLHNNGAGSPGVFALRSTIVANPASGANCVGSLLSQGNNLASDASCGLAAAGDLPSTNPLLGPLANNGGPTQTHGLAAGSPAVDAANPVGAPAVDQRGVARPVGSGFDIGAFEGTIAGALPTLSINNVSGNEGDAGTTTFTFTVTLSATSASTVTVDFATANGTATAGSDYAALSGTLTFAPQTTTQIINVTVTGDTSIEANETFFVNLSNPSNATLAAGQGTGTIVNDDAAPPPRTAANIPTLSEWMLALLAALVAMAASTKLRWRRVR